MSDELGVGLTQNEKQYIQQHIVNATLTRADLLSKLIDPRRDIDDECGYPKNITTQQYRLMYDREGLATRVVSLYPEESWAVDPVIYETEDATETEFEKAWAALEDRLQTMSYMEKVDEISGIGRFGVLLLGIDDGLSFSSPVSGINARGEADGSAKHALIYLRAFDESNVSVKTTETDQSNPRFGKPLTYSIELDDTTTHRADTGEQSTTITGQELIVHWSRVIHVADNRKSSEVYGVPRMQTLFNRLYDIRKIAGGSAEMFWKGGFPGFVFEMDPSARILTPDEKQDLRDEVIAYANGLQRYMMFQGIKTNPLPPQVADPQSHIDMQIMLISIALGVPKRVFMGSEQAQLASAQDSKSWNRRLARRQNKYLTPEIIRPFVDRMIAFGVLPEPKTYDVAWPDLNSLSENDRADVLAKRTEAFAKYVQGGVDQLVPPEEYLTMIAGMQPAEVEQIMDAALERAKDIDDDMPEEPVAVGSDDGASEDPFKEEAE